MLKAYSFTRINENNENEDCFLTFDSQSCGWKMESFCVIFNCYHSAEEMDGDPFIQFDMRLFDGDFLQAGLQFLTKEDKSQPFLFVFSNVIWRMAETFAFIPDWVNGVKTMKSLTDLNAILHEFELNG